MGIDTILQTAIELGAFDVHLISGHVAMVRIHTVIQPMAYPVTTPEGAMRMLESMATEAQLRLFGDIKDVDFSYHKPGLSRFRVNAQMQRLSVGISYESDQREGAAL